MLFIQTIPPFVVDLVFLPYVACEILPLTRACKNIIGIAVGCDRSNNARLSTIAFWHTGNSASTVAAEFSRYMVVCVHHGTSFAAVFECKNDRVLSDLVDYAGFAYTNHTARIGGNLVA